jgi:DNA-nicking Smr family endonuclease
MKHRHRALSQEEWRLWAHVAGQVTPLPGRTLPALARETPPTEPARVPESGHVDARPAGPAGATRVLTPLAPLERRVRQRLARGQTPIDGVLDLHGLRQDDAHRALLAFLHRRQRQGAALVLIVTGKGGATSPTFDGGERGVLRRLVPHWLAEPHLRRVVVGFETAARGHGGEGALYVRLRKAAAAG